MARIRPIESFAPHWWELLDTLDVQPCVDFTIPPGDSLWSWRQEWFTLRRSLESRAFDGSLPQEDREEAKTLFARVCQIRCCRVDDSTLRFEKRGSTDGERKFREQLWQAKAEGDDD